MPSRFSILFRLFDNDGHVVRKNGVLGGHTPGVFFRASKFQPVENSHWRVHSRFTIRAS
jgi:hypothetical protein